MRRLRALTRTLLEVWSALSASERAIVDEFCRHILQGAVIHQKSLDGRRFRALPVPAAPDVHAS